MAIQAKAVYPTKLGKIYVNNPKQKETLKKKLVLGEKKIYIVIVFVNGNLLIL